jgi:TRIAP1/MDM35 family protein
MAQSLDERCTRLKLEYDSCFNSWFEGYLEPAVSASASPESRAKYSKEKAEEYERKCGKIWATYRDCVQVRQFYRFIVEPQLNEHGDTSQKAVKEKGLDNLLDQARRENPLKDPPHSVDELTKRRS